MNDRVVGQWGLPESSTGRLVAAGAENHVNAGLQLGTGVHQSVNMDLLINKAWRQWRDQELALFARRAHRQLGRGFVLADDDHSPPIYVTRIAGAPPELIEAVLEYDPEREALVVWDDEPDDDSVVLSCVRIAPRH